jgi:hypothetical protein
MPGDMQMTTIGNAVSTDALNILESLLKFGMSQGELYDAIRQVARDRDRRLYDRQYMQRQQRQMIELGQAGVISRDKLMESLGLDVNAEREALQKERQTVQSREERKRAAVVLITDIVLKRKAAGCSEWFQRADVMQFCRRDARRARNILTLAKEAGMIESKGRWWRKIRTPSSSQSSKGMSVPKDTNKDNSGVRNVFGTKRLSETSSQSMLSAKHFGKSTECKPLYGQKARP